MGRSLGQILIPIIGRPFAWQLIGFETQDVKSWEWYVEKATPHSNWHLFSTNPVSVLVGEEFKGKRIRTVVHFTDGTKTSRTSITCISQQALEHLTEPGVIRSFESKLSSLELIFRPIFQALEQREQQLQTKSQQLNSESKKLLGKEIEIQEETRELARQKSKISSLRSELQAQTKQAEDAIKRKQEELQAAITQFKSEKKSFLEDNDLQHQLDQVKSVKRDLEDEWDLLAKANKINTKLSPEQISEIHEIIDNAYKAAKRERSALLDAHRTRTDSNPTSWNDVHFDESK